MIALLLKSWSLRPFTSYSVKQLCIVYKTTAAVLLRLLAVCMYASVSVFCDTRCFYKSTILIVNHQWQLKVKNMSLLTVKISKQKKALIYTLTQNSDLDHDCNYSTNLYKNSKFWKWCRFILLSIYLVISFLNIRASELDWRCWHNIID